jgi:tetratricopeptide (TPR) repeat protein
MPCAATAPQEVAALHQRAAAAAPTLQRKLYHLGEAGLWPEAADAIAAAGDDMIRQGRLDTLVNWIRAVPAEAASRQPYLAYYRGLAAVQQGDLETAASYLNEARQAFAATGDRAGLGAALATLGSVAFLQLRPNESLEMVAQALVYPLEPAMRVQALMIRSSINLFVAADWLRAAADLDRALVLTQSSRDETALLALTFYLGQEFLALPDMLARVETFYQTVAADLGDVVSPVRLAVADVLAYIYLRRGDLDKAIKTGQTAVAIKEQLNGYPFLGMNAANTVALAYAVNGRYQPPTPISSRPNPNTTNWNGTRSPASAACLPWRASAGWKGASTTCAAFMPRCISPRPCPPCPLPPCCASWSKGCWRCRRKIMTWRSAASRKR